MTEDPTPIHDCGLVKCDACRAASLFDEVTALRSDNRRLREALEVTVAAWLDAAARNGASTLMKAGWSAGVRSCADDLAAALAQSEQPSGPVEERLRVRDRLIKTLAREWRSPTFIAHSYPSGAAGATVCADSLEQEWAALAQVSSTPQPDTTSQARGSKSLSSDIDPSRQSWEVSE